MGLFSFLFGDNYSGWSIGPIINGKNYSKKMPKRMETGFDFPYPGERQGHVNYVTKPTGPLAGKEKIVFKFKIVAEEGTRIVPINGRYDGGDYSGGIATLSVYIQQKGLKWSGRGHGTQRWWASGMTTQLKPGEFALEVPLTGPIWSGVNTETWATDTAAFEEAKAKAGKIGFTIGGGDGLGHGAYATAPARFELLHWEVV